MQTHVLVRVGQLLRNFYAGGATEDELAARETTLQAQLATVAWADSSADQALTPQKGGAVAACPLQTPPGTRVHTTSPVWHSRAHYKSCQALTPQKGAQ